MWYTGKWFPLSQDYVTKVFNDYMLPLSFILKQTGFFHLFVSLLKTSFTPTYEQLMCDHLRRKKVNLSYEEVSLLSSDCI